jgi:hypothetical protein
MATSPRSTFSAAADRLELFVRDVKQKQFDATGVTAIPLAPPPGGHPEEAWMREYATHSIGRIRPGSPPQSAFLAPPVQRPKRPRFSDTAQLPPEKRGERPRLSLGDSHESGHIGALLGKPAPRGGWFGRLFRHRDN